MKGIISMLRPNEYRTHTCGELRESDIGKKVRVSGWLENVRDHGGGKFADLRDQYGLVQVVVEDEEMLDGIPKESSIMVTGTVIERDEDTINKKLDTGYIEIVAETISVLGRVRSPLPFEVASSKEIKEDLRLKYRFFRFKKQGGSKEYHPPVPGHIFYQDQND
jgi:aspartyl-tRNA synthetase